MISTRPFVGAKVFHYCINQKHQPHTDLEKYKRLDDGRYKAWFVTTLPSADDKEWLKTYSTISYLFHPLARLLTVRSEWSRK